MPDKPALRRSLLLDLHNLLQDRLKLKGIRLSRIPDNELRFLAGGVRIQACDG